MSRPSSVIPLKTSSLTVYTSSLSLSAHHKKMLVEKKREFQELIKAQKRDFDLEAQECSAKLTLNGNSQSEAYRKLRTTQQSHLEDLQKRCQDRLNHLFHRFQREWMTNPTQEESSPVAYSGSEHGAYIASTVGRALELGLTEVCLQQPEDPIEFLSIWLRSYSHTLHRRKEEAVEAVKVQLAIDEQHLLADHTKTLHHEAVHVGQEKQRRKEEYLKQTKILSQEADTNESMADTHNATHLDSLQPPLMTSQPLPAGDTISSPSDDPSADSIATPPVSPIEEDPISFHSEDSRSMAVLYTIHEKSTEEHNDM